MRRFLIVLITCLMPLLCACGGAEPDTSSIDSEEAGASIFDGLKLAERIDCKWLFIPEEASLIRATEEGDILAASFKGCEAKEITAYAEALYNTLKERGCTVYDATEFSVPVKMESFKAASLDLNFAGLAYRYYYVYESGIYMLSIQYYGCAGGTYGNGQSTVRISDVTESAAELIKE